MTNDTKFIVVGKLVVILTRGADGFFHDEEGTIWAYKDESMTTDPKDRCGVAPIALPEWPIFQKYNDACAPHDFAYSSDVYQAFHDRLEADNYLQSLLDKEDDSFLGWLFRNLARWFGGRFWENPNTNNLPR